MISKITLIPLDKLNQDSTFFTRAPERGGFLVNLITLDSLSYMQGFKQIMQIISIWI